MSLSVASLTWADTASNSNADYEFKSVSEPMILAAASVYDAPVKARVNGTFQALQYDSTMSYIMVPKGTDCLFWYPQGNLALSIEPTQESVLAAFTGLETAGIVSGYSVGGSFPISSFIVDDAIQVGSSGGIEYYFLMTPLQSDQKMRIIQYSSFDSLAVNINGVYTKDDKLFSTSVQQGGYFLRSIGPYSTSRYSVFKFPTGGRLKKDYEYSFTFYCQYSNSDGYDNNVYADPSSGIIVSAYDHYYVFSVKPTRDMDLSELAFCVSYGSSSAITGGWYYVSSSSTYIPVADTGQQGQVTAANTTVIKNVVTNISNTVSNISNQITNTTNTITNTITNTTNQIKEAVNQSANQISQTVTNTSNQIKDSVNQSAEKISQTVTNKVNEVNGTINSVGQKTQEKIDDMQKAVVDKLEDTKTGIIIGIIDGLKSLFIPSDDFFKTWFDDMYSFFDERLGFLMLPVDLLVNLIDIVVSADSSNAGILFPEIKWEGTVLIPAQTVRIEIFDTDFGKDLQDKLYFVGNVIMIGALLSLMYRKFEEVLRS